MPFVWSLGLCIGLLQFRIWSGGTSRSGNGQGGNQGQGVIRGVSRSGNGQVRHQGIKSTYNSVKKWHFT